MSSSRQRPTRVLPARLLLARWAGGAVVAASVLASACADAPSAPTAPAVYATGRRSAAEQAAAEAALGPELAALREITRVAALALNDQGLRSRVKNDLRAARVTREHKLEFRSYLNGESGGILLAKMAKHGGVSRDSVKALVAAVRPLEFYMPIREQRESWTGGSDLLVASLLDDEDVPVVYDLQGAEVSVGADTKTPLPTLAIVPVESDFAAPLDPAKVKNVSDKGGTTIGTFMMLNDCGGETAIVECGGGGGGYDIIPQSPGRYVTRIRVEDDGEGLLKGDPEIELHVQGPTSPAAPLYGADLSCSGARVTGDKNFDQNGKDWSGSVQLFRADEGTDYDAKFKTGYSVMVWEDDDTSCVLKNDNLNLETALRGIGTISAGVVAVVATKDLTKIAAAVGTFIGSIYTSAGWLRTNDDYLGSATRIEYTPFDGQFTDANYILYKDKDRFNGRLNIIDK